SLLRCVALFFSLSLPRRPPSLSLFPYTTLFRSTETYLNADGELKARDLVGSIPARNDASQEKAKENAELLEPFATSLNEMGARYPAANLSPDSVADVQSTMGEAWSAVLAGQQSPEDAAAQVVNTLKRMTG